MNIYNYSGKDKNGELVKGQIEAESEIVAARILASREVVTIHVSLAEQHSFSFFERVSLKEKVIMIRQLATMINAGLPIAQSLKTLQVQTKKPYIKKILSSALADIEGGAPLSVAFGKFPKVFSQIDLTLIASGETSGSIDKALLRMSDQLEKQQGILRKVRGALIYPAFVLTVVIGVVAVMLIYVMPQMDSLYLSFGAKLPLLTRILISTSKILTKFAPLVIILIVGIIIFIGLSIRKPLGRKVWDNTKLSIPVFKELLKKMYMARFARTLSGLVGSGVPLLDSLNVVSKAIGNVAYNKIIMDSADKVKAGVALSETLQNNPLIPPVVPQMVSVGEKTGELDNMLSNLADYYEDEVDVTVKAISSLIEPMMIVLLGGTVGVIMLAIMLPIYQISKVVGV